MVYSNSNISDRLKVILIDGNASVTTKKHRKDGVGRREKVVVVGENEESGTIGAPSLCCLA